MREELINFRDTSFAAGSGATYGKLQVRLNINMIFPDEDKNLSLELSAGADRMYPVRYPGEFLDEMEQQRAYRFHKDFIFEPDRMFFPESDRKILMYLCTLKNEQKQVETGVLIEDGRIRIDEMYRNRFLDLLWQERGKLNVKTRGKEFNIRSDLTLKVSAAQEKTGSILMIDYTDYGVFQPLVSDYSYLYLDGKRVLAKLTGKESELFRQINPYQNDNCKIRIQIAPEDLKLFRKNFLEVFGKEIKIKLDTKTRKKLEQSRLVSKVYFDTAMGGIISKVEFCYGAQVYNPLGSEAVDKRNREYDREHAITSQMKALGFRKLEKLYILNEVERIVHLLTDDLTELKKLSEIYYSQDFKKLYVKSPELGGLSLSEDGSVIHMDINLENVSDEELEELLDAIKAGKKYYRLRNGSIVNLNTADSEKFIGLINGLGLDADSVHNGIFEVPLNRCLYLDRYRKENGISGAIMDERFGGLIRSLDGESDDTKEKLFPDHLKGILRDYQIQGIRWMKQLSSYSFGGILADEMGLGKTLQVLAFLAGERKKLTLPSLVTAPTSLLYNWKQEAGKFLPELKVLIVQGTKERRAQLLSEAGKYSLLVTSYHMLSNDQKLYENMKFSYVFVDEAQNIKNPETWNAKSVKQLKAGCCFAITGMPIENRLLELWSIFDFVMPGYLFSRKEFQETYENPIMVSRDSPRQAELSKMVRPFILRRKKEDVLTELPELTQTNYLTQMTEPQKKLYAAYYKDLKRELLPKIDQYGIERNRIEILSALTRLRQICAHPATFLEDYSGGSGKLDFAMDLITEALGAGHSILVFSQFTSMLKIVERELLKRQMNYYYLDGRMKAEERAEEVENFNADQAAVFLISLKAGGTGLNLAKADIVIQFDPWWNPAVESQASARAHRLGQKHPVQVYHLLTQGTIEEKIADLQEKKKELIGNILEPVEGFLNGLNEEELRDILDL